MSSNFISSITVSYPDPSCMERGLSMRLGTRFHHRSGFYGPQFPIPFRVNSKLQILWIAVNLQQYNCKYKKPQFNYQCASSSCYYC